jgi:hypothetical protein
VDSLLVGERANLRTPDPEAIHIYISQTSGVPRYASMDNRSSLISKISRRHLGSSYILLKMTISYSRGEGRMFVAREIDASVCKMSGKSNSLHAKGLS